MKKVYFIILIIILLLSGCGIKTKKYTDINDVNYTKLISSKNQYIGDASSDVEILSYLPGREFLSGIEIKDKRLIVNYGIEKNLNLTEDDLYSFWDDNRTKKVFMYNSTMILSLIDNAEGVTLMVNKNPRISLSIEKSQINSLFKEASDSEDLNDINIALLKLLNSDKNIEEFYNYNKINIYAF